MRRGLAVVALVAAAGTSTSAAADDGKVAARALFSQGVKLNEAGDTAGALAAFRAAYDKSPSFRVLYNIGQLCAKTGDPVCAVRSYEQYLADGGSDVSARRRSDVEADLVKLKKLVASIVVTASPPGAEIAVDDAPAGRSPLASPVLVLAGAHKLVATLDGRTAERSVRVAGGESAAVELVVPPPTPPPEPPAPAATAPPPATTTRLAAEPEPKRVPVVPWVVTGGFAIATVVGAVLTESRYNAFVDKRESFPVTRGALDDAQSSARSLFIVTSALGAATLASAGVATYFTFFARPGGGGATLAAAFP
jgi:hypothetical protein